MRFSKVWIIVRKEFSEFRVNRYIMYSLILMPLLLAVVMPALYLFPIASSISPAPTHPMQLNITITQEIHGARFDNITISHMRLIDSQVTNVVAIGCEFGGGRIRGSVVQDSNLTQVKVGGSSVLHCNVWNSTISDSNLAGSLLLGQEDPNLVIMLRLVDSILVFFILIPAIIPTVIASYTFVGEKLNKSLEPLLATPTTDSELLFGKTLAIIIPCVLITWMCAIPAIVIADVAVQPVLGYYPLPNLTWAIGIFLAAPLFCVLSTLGNVIVSARVTDVRTSQQLGSLVVLPIVLFFVLAFAGFLTPAAMLLACGLILLVDVLVFYLARRSFQREQILVRWK